MPAGVVADPDPKSDGQLRREAAKAQLDADGPENREDEDGPATSGAVGREDGGTSRDSHDTAAAFEAAARAAVAHSLDDDA